MKWAQFKDPVSHMCLAGSVVASWSITQEVAGLSHFTVMTNIFVTEFALTGMHSCNVNGFCGYHKVSNWLNVRNLA